MITLLGAGDTTSVRAPILFAVAVNSENEGELYSVTLGNENEVVFDPETGEDVGKVSDGEVVLRPSLVDNHALCDEGLPYLVERFRMATLTSS